MTSLKRRKLEVFAEHRPRAATALRASGAMILAACCATDSALANTSLSKQLLRGGYAQHRRFNKPSRALDCRANYAALKRPKQVNLLLTALRGFAATFTAEPSTCRS